MKHGWIFLEQAVAGMKSADSDMVAEDWMAYVDGDRAGHGEYPDVRPPWTGMQLSAFCLFDRCDNGSSQILEG